MGVHENIAFDPCIGAVQVEHVIDRASENVIVVLDNFLAEIAIAAGEIHDVVIAAGIAKETITDDAAPAALDPACAVEEFGGGGAGWKNATFEEERTVIER